MKNILDEKPEDNLFGRLGASVRFIDKETDIYDKRILDIGCGYGWFEKYFLQFNPEEMVGIEISEVDLKTIRENVHDVKLKTKEGSAINIPSNDSYFDTVVSWEVIEHIPRNTEEKMFQEVSRVLKPNGHFYLSTPFDNIFSKIFDPAWWFGHRHYSFEYLESIGNRHGFDVEEYYIFGNAWLILDMINMYVAKWIFRRRKFFANFFDKKVEESYSGMPKNGIVNIFIKYRKK